MSDSGRSLATSIALCVLAVAGLIGAHAVDYLLLARDPVYREHVLAGHAFLPQAGGIALLSMFAFVIVNWSLRLGDRARSGARLPGFGASFVRLGLAQVLGFVALETVERIGAGVPVHHLVSPLIPAGVGLQIAVAAIGALVLIALRTVARAVARALRPTRRRPRRAPARKTRLFDLVHPVSQLWLSSAPARAPPAPSV